jgi:hypothetical protein
VEDEDAGPADAASTAASHAAGVSTSAGALLPDVIAVGTGTADAAETADALGAALLAACVRDIAAEGLTVGVFYASGPDTGGIRRLVAARPETPLLWCVGGEEQSLPARMVEMTSGHEARSVLLGRSVDGLGIPAVVVHEQGATAQTTDHLIALGHRRIAYVGSDPARVEGWRRYRGFAGSMWDAGLELPVDWVFSASPGAVAPDARFERAMGSPLRPTAVVCSSDTLAAQVIHRLGSMGLACPSDVAVVGLGDEPFAAFLAEPLTTFRLDVDAASRHVAEAVRRFRAGEPVESQQVSGRMVVRTSCGGGRSRA